MSDLPVALVFFNILLDICIVYKLFTFPIHSLNPCFSMVICLSSIFEGISFFYYFWQTFFPPISSVVLSFYLEFLEIRKYHGVFLWVFYFLFLSFGNIVFAHRSVNNDNSNYI